MTIFLASPPNNVLTLRMSQGHINPNSVQHLDQTLCVWTVFSIDVFMSWFCLMGKVKVRQALTPCPLKTELCDHTGPPRQTDRQSDRQAGRQADRQADRQTDRQADRQTDRQADRQTDRQTDRQCKELSYSVLRTLVCDVY